MNKEQLDNELKKWWGERQEYTVKRDELSKFIWSIVSTLQEQLALKNGSVEALSEQNEIGAEEYWSLKKLNEHHKELWQQGIQIIDALNKEQWIIISPETILEDGVEVLGYSPSWINPDFNPKGIRTCFHTHYGWVSAKWNDSQDSWHTHSKEFCPHPETDDFDPSHFMYVSPPNT